MWVIGGSDRNDVWSSSDGRTWIQVTGAAPWSGRADHTSVVMGGKMWVMGGTDLRYDPSQREPKNDVWYSADGADWTLATSDAVWEPRSGHTSVVFADRIWVVNGVGRFLGPDFANGQRDIWSSEDGVTWRRATDEAPWSYRSSHTSLVFQDKLWVIGGFTGGGFAGPVYLNDVWHCVTPDFALPFRDLANSFYESILGRPAEVGAVDAWQTGYFDYAVSFDIDVRLVAREMARLFFLSEEYAARNRTDSEFITDCYQVFLSRAPSQTELDNWLGGTWNRSQVVTVFSESEEFANRIAAMYPGLQGNPTRNFVTTMYIGLLDRLVDQSGLEYASGLFDAAYAEQSFVAQVPSAVTAGGALVAQPPSAVAIDAVDAIQESDPGGGAVAALTDGATRKRSGIEAVRAQAKQMAREVIVSAEFLGKQPTTADCVERFYRAFLGRFPNEAELAYWTAELDSGRRTTDDVIDLFGGSQEFTARLEEFFTGGGPSPAPIPGGDGQEVTVHLPGNVPLTLVRTRAGGSR
jgi:hypothetical protein